MRTVSAQTEPSAYALEPRGRFLGPAAEAALAVDGLLQGWRRSAQRRFGVEAVDRGDGSL